MPEFKDEFEKELWTKIFLENLKREGVESAAVHADSALRELQRRMPKDKKLS